MAEITKQEHELITAIFSRFAESLRRAGLAADELSTAFADVAEAARKVDFPPLREVARIRMLLMKETHGIARFLMPSWWQWFLIALRPNT